MKTLLRSFLLLALVALPAAAHAQLLGDTLVPFSADRTVVIDNRTYSGKIYARPGYQRHEQEISGMAQVILLRRDDARGWLVLPSARSYVEFSFPAALAELSDPSLRGTALGQETVAGLRTTKYRVEHTARDGSTVDGYVWVSKDEIIAKAEGTYTAAKSGKPVAVRMLLANIRTAPQDASLFAPPQNFVKLPPGALQPLLGGRG
jgi:hypothetical protein